MLAVAGLGWPSVGWASVLAACLGCWAAPRARLTCAWCGSLAPGPSGACLVPSRCSTGAPLDEAWLVRCVEEAGRATGVGALGAVVLLVRADRGVRAHRSTLAPIDLIGGGLG